MGGNENIKGSKDRQVGRNFYVECGGENLEGDRRWTVLVEDLSFSG